MKNKKQELEHLYQEEQLSTHEIAEIKGVSQTTVWRWMKKLKIERRTYKDNKMPVKKGSHLTKKHKEKISEALKKRNWMKNLNPKKHPKWKGGKRIYRRLALSKKDLVCEICGAKEKKVKNSNLHVHHIDEDRDNNNLNNLMVLCSSCHKKVHMNLIDDTSS